MSEMSVPACDASTLSIGQCATLACLLEVSAPKPGNVHRGADFEDMTFVDFAISAVAIAPAMENAVRHGVGQAVWEAIQATRALVRTNTNLGTVLLLAPLAAVPRDAAAATRCPAGPGHADAARQCGSLRSHSPGPSRVVWDRWTRWMWQPRLPPICWRPCKRPATETWSRASM